MTIERWIRAKRWIFYREQLDTDEGTSHAVVNGLTFCGRPVSTGHDSMWFRDGVAPTADYVSCSQCKARMKREVA